MHDSQRSPGSTLAKTKIVATVGPASCAKVQLTELVRAGVDLFRLNFAHGSHEWLEEVLETIREVSRRLQTPIAVLGDLSGPKIRLGELVDDEVHCEERMLFEFIRGEQSHSPSQLTSTYPQLIDDLEPGNRVLLADGTVTMRVTECDSERAVCVVEQPGVLRSRQGINLPGVKLSTPCLTPKDEEDLVWAVRQQLDYVGLSFVRAAEDVRVLRARIRQLSQLSTASPPRIVAKIEKAEAIEDLEAILRETDAVMVARGDLGVEVDITRVPRLQKQIIRACNEHRIPVITATQMLDSMQSSEMPTRAEASDVANAVLDGTDAVMLSGETAIGEHPQKVVSVMNRILRETEPLISPHPDIDVHSDERTRAHDITEAVTRGATVAAESVHADLVVVCTHNAATAMALSKQRSHVPILALTDQPSTARRMCLLWGVIPVVTEAVNYGPQQLLEWVVRWARQQQLVVSGHRLVLVAQTSWTRGGHDMMVIHTVS